LHDGCHVTASHDLVALGAVLGGAAAQHFGSAVSIEGLNRLSGGASRETWSFDALTADGRRYPLILRRDPGAEGRKTTTEASSHSVERETEWHLLKAVGAAGALVPRVRFPLTDSAGGGYVMDRVPGETIARRILKDDAFAAARTLLAAQCGAAIARIHAIPTAGLPALRTIAVEEQLAYHRRMLDRLGEPQPTFELALRWLRRHAPGPVPPTLVHGDFRHGNLIIGPEGLRAVIDWELPHFGDPMEDLGWICVKSWRFGVAEKPVGGFGVRADLFRGYEAAGGRKVDPERVHFWEVLGSLRWGVICMNMAFTHLSGADRSVERAAIGRRVSETEHDLLLLLG
jgi:aminoglycoside phosphotransferase (APT) family kinase protein